MNDWFLLSFYSLFYKWILQYIYNFSAIIHHFQQFGLFPNSLYYFTFAVVEFSKTLNAIIMEVTLKIFPIR